MASDDGHGRTRSFVPGPAAAGHRSVLDDQAARWAAGDRVRVEDYLDRHPTLLAAPAAVLDLIYHELVLRERAGEKPAKEEYAARFPHLAGDPDVLFELDGLLGSGARAETAVAGPDVSGDASHPPAPGPVVPGYEIERLLGRGGMGVVYLARHLRLNRLVALKVVLAGAHADRGQLVRFLAEAEAIAALQHPNIVQIHEVGQVEGLPYFTLEYCPGGSLAETAGRGVMPPGEAARLVETLARAVAYAHSREIVHRDLTPANVLLTADGEPKISDFGLAKRLNTGAGLTGTRVVMGTPSYMAPEQAEGKGRDVGPAADVYGLGAILYRLLTGAAPFTADTTEGLLLKVITADPVPPTAVRPGLPGDLETICLKCLRKNPHARYISAEALADDVRRFRAGEPITARPVSTAERVWRWGRRNPGWAAALSAVGLFLVVVAAGSSVAAYLLNEARNEAKDNARRADDARREQADLLVTTLKSVPGEVRAMRLRGDRGAYFDGMPRLRETLARARALGAPADVLLAVRNEMTNLLTVTDLKVVSEWDGWPGGTAGVELSPRLDRYVRWPLDGPLTLHESGTGRELSRLPPDPLARRTPNAGVVQFSRDGRRIAFRTGVLTLDRLRLVWRNGVVCWAVDENPPRKLWQVTDANHAAFTPDGKFALVGRSDFRSTLVLDAETGREVRRFEDGGLQGTDPIHPVRPWAVLAARDRMTTVDYRTGDRIGPPIPGRWGGVAWHPTAPVFVAADEGSLAVELWDATTGTHAPYAPAVSTLTTVSSFLPSGKQVLMTDWSPVLRIWDGATGWQQFRYPGASWASARVAVAPDGRTIGPGLSGGRLHLYELYTGEGLRVVTRPQEAGFGDAVAVSRDGRVAAINRVEGWVELVDGATGRRLAALPLGTHLVGGEPESGALVTYGRYGIQRWGYQDRGGRVTVGPPTGLGPSEDFSVTWGMSSDASVIARPLRKWVVIRRTNPTGFVETHTNDRNDVRHARVSPDGRWVLAGSHVTGGVTMNTADGGYVQQLLPDGGMGEFSTRGGWVAAFSHYGGGKLFRQVGDRWEERRHLPGHRATFDPTDRIVAVAAGDGIVVLLECETGREIARLESPDRGELSPSRFSRDGGTLYAVGLDSRVLYIWDIRSLRARLKAMDADWEWSELQPAPTADPVTAVEVLEAGGR